MTYKLTKEQDGLLRLLRAAIGTGGKYHFPEGLDWNLLFDLSEQHGVSAICVDALNNNPSLAKSIPANSKLEYRKFQCLGLSMQMEQMYDTYLASLTKLVRFFNRQEIKVLLLKGYGLSLNYPIPNHRPVGDIDLYHYGLGWFADQILLDKFDIETKQNEDKHSTYVFEGITVENHAAIVDDIRHPSLANIEKFFEKDAVNATIHILMSTDGFSSHVYLPSASTNALFLPLHTGVHYVHGETSIRQICDWFFFVKSHHKDVDWMLVENMSREAGFFDFFCILNGICIDFLGADESWFPKWKRDIKNEEKVLCKVLSLRDNKKKSLAKKVIRFFNSYNRYKLVYKDNFFMSIIRQTKAYVRVKWDKRGPSIWKKGRYIGRKQGDFD